MSKILLKLDQEKVTTDFYENLRIIGVVSPMQDYVFSWHIKRYTGIDFRIQNDKEILLEKRKRKYYYSLFEHIHPIRQLVYYLYSNHYEGEYLLPELKSIDFLWLLKNDEVYDEEMNLLMQSIKIIPGVQLVNEIPINKIKNKQHLLL